MKAGDLVKDKQGAIREVREVYDDGWVETVSPDTGHDPWDYPIEELKEVDKMI